MRQLKTPEQIKDRIEFFDKGTRAWTDEEVNRIIKAAQRDALECAADSAKLSYDDHGYPEFMRLDKLKEFIEAWDLKVDKSSILNLMPEL